MAWKLPPDQDAMGGVLGSQDVPLWLQSGAQQAPPNGPAQRLLDPFNMPQKRGFGEAIASALLPQMDEKGMYKGPGIADMIALPLMGMGLGRPTAAMPKAPMFRANNYTTPPVAANAVPASEMTRLQTELSNMMPINAGNEARALALRDQIRKLDDLRSTMHDSAFFGRRGPSPQKPNPLTTDLDELYGAGSPQDRAKQLGIRIVDPNNPGN